MKKQYVLITLITTTIAILIVGYYVMNDRVIVITNNTDSSLPTEDPLDIVSNFYNDYVSASLSTSTTVAETGLLTSTLVSVALQNRLAAQLATTTDGVRDPIVCQTTIPERVGGKILFIEPREAQIMMLARGLEAKSPYQAIVSLEAVAGKWQISDINCAQGEVAPVRDYDFEQEGFLLKSVPPPLNPDVWHLVYEEDGQMGRTVPLTINDSSVCIQINGDEAPCNEADFKDATKVFLQADMSEVGATVRRLEF